MKVLIVDDHPLVLQGLTTVLSSDQDFRLIFQANNGEEALKKYIETQPDIVIVDLRLGKEHGFDIIKEIKAKEGVSRFVILTSSHSLDDFVQANELSVDGYISKEAPPEEFLAAVKLIKNGRKYFDAELVNAYMGRGQSNPLEGLTCREREVLNCLGKGLKNREIAKKLFITEFTVKKHVSQILEKLILSDRTQAALFAVKHCAGL